MRGHSLSAAVWWEPKVPVSDARTLEHKHCDLESDLPVRGLEHLQRCLTCSLDDPNSLWGRGLDEGRFFLMPLRVLTASVLTISRPSLRLLITNAQPHRDLHLPLQGLSL